MRELPLQVVASEERQTETGLPFIVKDREEGRSPMIRFFILNDRFGLRGATTDSCTVNSVESVRISQSIACVSFFKNLLV